MIIDFFNNTNSNQSTHERIKKLQKQMMSPVFSEDYCKYGFDYFDNPIIGIGYGGYFYDGRYCKPVSAICDYYNLQHRSRILEIGSAKGYILAEFFKLGMQVTGIDLSEYAIKNAYPAIRSFLLIGDICQLPFSDNFFDFVLCKEVLPHMTERRLDQAVSECVRVSNGKIFFEIQTGRSVSELQMMRKWDCTHKIAKTPEWWNERLELLGYTGDVNYKILFPEETA